MSLSLFFWSSWTWKKHFVMISMTWKTCCSQDSFSKETSGFSLLIIQLFSQLLVLGLQVSHISGHVSVMLCLCISVRKVLPKSSWERKERPFKTGFKEKKARAEGLQRSFCVSGFIFRVTRRSLVTCPVVYLPCILSCLLWFHTHFASVILLWEEKFPLSVVTGHFSSQNLLDQDLSKPTDKMSPCHATSSPK